jgi:hypothetical protein
MVDVTPPADSTDVAGISLEVSRDCLVTRTRQLSRVLTALYNDQLRPFGLNYPSSACWS